MPGFCLGDDIHRSGGEHKQGERSKNDCEAGAYAYSSATPLADALIFELASGFEFSKGDPSAILGATEGMTQGSAITVFQTYMNSDDSMFQSIGLAGLLQSNQAEGLARVAQLEHSLTGEPGRHYLISAIRDYWRDTSPASTTQLIALFSDTSISGDIREAAVRSLIATHTATSLPFFGVLLSSPDLTGQMWAVIAISSFVNGCPVQSSSTMATLDHLKCSAQTPYKDQTTMKNFVFRRGPAEEEREAVIFWKGWWAGHPELH